MVARQPPRRRHNHQSGKSEMRVNVALEESSIGASLIMLSMSVHSIAIPTQSRAELRVFAVEIPFMFLVTAGCSTRRNRQYLQDVSVKLLTISLVGPLYSGVSRAVRLHSHKDLHFKLK
jgi:hypothetical protein